MKCKKCGANWNSPSKTINNCPFCGESLMDDNNIDSNSISSIPEAFAYIYQTCGKDVFYNKNGQFEAIYMDISYNVEDKYKNLLSIFLREQGNRKILEVLDQSDQKKQITIHKICKIIKDNYFIPEKITRELSIEFLKCLSPKTSIDIEVKEKQKSDGDSDKAPIYNQKKHQNNTKSQNNIKKERTTDIEDELKKYEEEQKSGPVLTQEQNVVLDSLKIKMETEERMYNQFKKEYESMEEHQTLLELNIALNSKKERLNTLGFFKKREKKELELEIESLKRDAKSIHIKIFQKEQRYKSQWDKLQKSIENYRNYSENINIQFTENIQRKIRKLFDGYSYTFGVYKNEVIEWKILDKVDSKLLVISKYLLASKEYHSGVKDISWADSSLRGWLNKDFFNEAFSEQEKKQIIETNLINEDNEDYGTLGGRDTRDKVFILSIKEAKKYFESESKRKTSFASFVDKKGVNKNYNYSIWWLRNPGKESDRAAIVGNVGSINTQGLNSFFKEIGVRPAMWIEIDDNIINKLIKKNNVNKR